MLVIKGVYQPTWVIYLNNGNVLLERPIIYQAIMITICLTIICSLGLFSQKILKMVFKGQVDNDNLVSNI